MVRTTITLQWKFTADSDIINQNCWTAHRRAQYKQACPLECAPTSKRKGNGQPSALLDESGVLQSGDEGRSPELENAVQIPSSKIKKQGLENDSSEHLLLYSHATDKSTSARRYISFGTAVLPGNKFGGLEKAMSWELSLEVIQIK